MNLSQKINISLLASNVLYDIPTMKKPYSLISNTVYANNWY